MSNKQSSQINVKHLKSESELLQLISDKDVLVVIDCYSEWCGPCRVLGEQLKKLVVEWKKSYGKNIEVCKLNVDESYFAKFVELNKIKSLPTVLFVRGDDVVGKVVGNDIVEIKTTVHNLLEKNKA